MPLFAWIFFLLFNEAVFPCESLVDTINSKNFCLSYLKIKSLKQHLKHYRYLFFFLFILKSQPRENVKYILNLNHEKLTFKILKRLKNYKFKILNF
jgi:hypothetical protein